MKRAGWWLTGAAALVLLTCPPARAERWEMKTADGVTLVGNFEGFEGCERAAVLLHMLGRTKADWKTFQIEAANKGVCTVAIDMRGHGESTKHAGKPDLDHEYFLPQDWTNVARNDIRAAYDLLQEKIPPTSPKPVLVGASIGANLAILGGTYHWVGGVAALSPGLKYKGIEPMVEIEKLKHPLFVSASKDDPYAFDSAHKLRKAYPDKAKALYFRHAGHGTHMLKGTNLQNVLIDWIKNIKTPGGENEGLPVTEEFEANKTAPEGQPAE